MFTGFSDSSNPAEIAVEAHLSPFETASPLPGVEKAFHVYVNLALSGREYLKTRSSKSPRCDAVPVGSASCRFFRWSKGGARV